MKRFHLIPVSISILSLFFNVVIHVYVAFLATFAMISLWTVYLIAINPNKDKLE